MNVNKTHRTVRDRISITILRGLLCCNDADSAATVWRPPSNENDQNM